MPPKPVLNIYTDGACSGNPGPGGWGAYLEYGDGEDGSKKITKEIFGYSHETTNNQMEIVAAIEALKILKIYYNYHKDESVKKVMGEFNETN